MNDKHIKINVAAEYPDYLRDESRLTGRADGIAFPESEAEIADLLRNSSGSITIQGGRTGITGGAVPAGGVILNLTRMTTVTPPAPTGIERTPFSIRVQPGLLLSDLRKAISDSGCGCFFPPDPTEDTATIGGMISCNASGARSFKYGPTRAYVNSMRIVLASGEILQLDRNSTHAAGRHFAVSSGETIYEGMLPSYELPRVKNASGYFSADNMPLLDLFIGAEGTLGVISEAELILVQRPQDIWAIMAFFPSTANSLRYVKACKSLQINSLAAVEFFDSNALSLLRTKKAQNPAFSYLPAIDPDWNSCVYTELDGNADDIESAAMQIAEQIEECGGSDSATWMATSSTELEKMKQFRHALPEAVNLTIDEYRTNEPEITKLGTDFAVPDKCVEETLTMYETDLSAAGMNNVIFGHIGDSHVHVNILPRSLCEYDAGKQLYLKWARAVVAKGGTVSAEHGIGKIKASFLLEMYGPDGIKEMKAVKQTFDPNGRLNPGNLFGDN